MVDSEKYMNERVDEQIKWFDEKSVINKKKFLSFKVSEILLSLLIPLLAAYSTDEYPVWKVVVGVIGVAVAALAGIITLIRYQENWIEYRSVSEALKTEKNLFLGRAGHYKNMEEPFTVFVERIEEIILGSNKKWVGYMKRETKNDEQTSE